MAALCTYDRDCLDSQACYSNVSWYVPAPGENGCLCSTYYGWSGPACDGTGETPTSRVWIGFGVVIASSLLCILGIALSLVTRLYRLNLISFKAETIGTGQLIIACCFGIIHEVGATWAAYAPTFGGYIPGVPENDRQNLYHSVWQTFNALFVIVACGATMTIALVWIELANKAKSLSKSTGSLGKKNQVRMAIFEFVIMIAMIIPLVLGWIAIASLVSYVLIICLLSVYIYGYRMMTHVIASLGHNSSDSGSATSSSHIYKPVLKEMRRTAMWICGVVLVTTCMYTALVTTVFAGWKTASRPAPNVSTQVTLAKLVNCCVTVLEGATLHFLRQCGERQIKRQTKSVSAVDSHKIETHTTAL